MLGYVIIVSFLVGFVAAVYIFFKCLPHVMGYLEKVNEIDSRAAKAEGQNELYRDFVAALGGQNSQFVHAAIEVVKDANKYAHTQPQPLPQPIIQPENGTYTHTHAPTHLHTQINEDKKPTSDDVRLIVRGKAKDLGEYEFTASEIRFTDKEGNKYRIDLPKKGDNIVKFGGLKLYAGHCKNCNNRFVSVDAKTTYCKDTCKDDYHNSNRY